jgi:hypothetical protein
VLNIRECLLLAVRGLLRTPSPPHYPWCTTGSVFLTWLSLPLSLPAVYFPLTARGIPRVVSLISPVLVVPFPSSLPVVCVLRTFVELFIRRHLTGAVTPDHHQAPLTLRCRVSSLNCPRSTAHTFPPHLPRSWLSLSAPIFIALRHSLLNLRTVHGLPWALSPPHYQWYTTGSVSLTSPRSRLDCPFADDDHDHPPV